MAGDSAHAQAAGAGPEQALSARYADAVAVAAGDPGAAGAESQRIRRLRCALCNRASPPIEFGPHRIRQPTSPASIPPTFAARPIWPRVRARRRRRSSRKSSTTAASSGIAGRERWRSWASLAPTRCKPRRRKAPTPMPPAAGRSPRIKIFSPCGKTLTQTSPPTKKPRRSWRRCSRGWSAHAFRLLKHLSRGGLSVAPASGRLSGRRLACHLRAGRRPAIQPPAGRRYSETRRLRNISLRCAQSKDLRFCPLLY